MLRGWCAGASSAQSLTDIVVVESTVTSSSLCSAPTDAALATTLTAFGQDASVQFEDSTIGRASLLRITFGPGADVTGQAVRFVGAVRGVGANARDVLRALLVEPPLQPAQPAVSLIAPSRSGTAESAPYIHLHFHGMHIQTVAICAAVHI